MDERELNRVLEQVKPSQAQKEAMLSRLLEPERKIKPMKKLKKLTVMAVAAALMVVTCAAAVVTGFDQRLAEYVGAEPEQVELLNPGAAPLDLTVESNGASLHVTQILVDRCSILVMADFTLPDGTDMETIQDEKWDFVGFNMDGLFFLDEAKEAIDTALFSSAKWETLDDGDLTDNHISMLFSLTLSQGMEFDQRPAYLQLGAVDLQGFDTANPGFVTLCSGDWSMEIPIPQEDIGYIQTLDCPVGQLDGVNIAAKEIYLSPMTLRITLEREVPVKAENMTEEDEQVYSRWISAVNINRVTLADRDGNEIALNAAGGAIDDQNHYGVFHLTEITDVDQFQGGTLTLRIGDGSVEIPLDNLTPVA